MPQPTSPELELLKQLWKKEPLTARELHEKVGERLGWGYSTTRKTLERMGEKQFVDIQQQGNKKIYVSKLAKLPTLAHFARDFATRVLELDGPPPVAMFGDSKLLDKSEILELEKLLNETKIKVRK